MKQGGGKGARDREREDKGERGTGRERKGGNRVECRLKQ